MLAFFSPDPDMVFLVLTCTVATVQTIFMLPLLEMTWYIEGLTNLLFCLWANMAIVSISKMLPFTKESELEEDEWSAIRIQCNDSMPMCIGDILVDRNHLQSLTR